MLNILQMRTTCAKVLERRQN